MDTIEKQKKEVSIPLTQDELIDLMEGKHFHWDYAGGVHLYMSDSDESEL
jgi:hypothetical protein